MSSKIGTRALGCRVEEKVCLELEKAYGKANTGATIAARAWSVIRSKTIIELCRKIPKNDLPKILLGLRDYHAQTAGQNMMAFWLSEAGASEDICKLIHSLSFAETFFLVELATGLQGDNLLDISQKIKEYLKEV
jgi:hypothetical protein